MYPAAYPSHTLLADSAISAATSLDDRLSSSGQEQAHKAA